MNKTLSIALVLFVFAFNLFGQKLSKPTLTSVSPTASQQRVIGEGVDLHDAKKYEEAIAKYQTVLDESPECTAAMYEMASSLAAKGERLKSMEIATKGAKYISEELPLFYVLIANTLDDLGKPDDAVKIYKDGLKALEGDSRFGTYRASLYFNLGVTYFKQKNYPDAKSAFKSAIENNYDYASPNYLLAEVFYGTKYKIPALMAAARFITLEFNSQRSKRAAAIIDEVANPPKQTSPDGKITINLDLFAPTDEGEFGPVELILAASDRIDEKKGEDPKKDLSPEERFAGRIDTLISLLDVNDKKNKKTFVAINYFPFLKEMKSKGYVQAFAYVVSYVNGSAKAREWVNANEAKVKEMLVWAKAYQPARK